MAAAEYFSNAPMHQNNPGSYRPPTSQPQGPTSSQYPSQPVPSQQPQPQASSSSVHFALTPQEIPQRHSFSYQQRPPQGSWSGSPHLRPTHLIPQQQRPYGSTDSSPGTYGSPQQRPQYLSPHMRPYAQPNASQYSLTNGYASDPEPQRRRHKHHRSKRDDGNSRSMKDPGSRSKNTDALLGAAGGGLIGDLIFPGLGTVGGAALGWLGGKDYAKHRKGREERRADEQKDWQKKYRPDEYKNRDDVREYRDDRDRRRGSSEHYDRR